MHLSVLCIVFCFKLLAHFPGIFGFRLHKGKENTKISGALRPKNICVNFIVEDASSRVFCFIPFLSSKKLIATSQTLSVSHRHTRRRCRSKAWVSKGGVLYNFVLFPRDVLKMGMPTYSFSVQTSHLTSMAEEGFDFNACIYNVAMLVSPHLSFLAQERGLDSADLISFLVELSFHVNGEAYNINTFNERQNNIVKDLADLGLIKLQQGRKDSWFIPTNLATNLLVSLTDSSLRKQVGYLGGSTLGQSWSVDHMDAGKLARESTQIVSRILVKALKAMLSPDFSLCLCLIPERVGFGKLSLVAALAAQLAASVVQAGTKEITTKRNHCHQQLWLRSSSLSSIPPKFHYLSLLSLTQCVSILPAVKEECEETLEKIKEGSDEFSFRVGDYQSTHHQL
ncbi:hypothetical protein ACFX1X_020529 [Malus domestica]